jgi:hypothetical protein
MKDLDSAGQWWLPRAPEEVVVGLLKYSDAEGFRLSIPFGHLGGMGEMARRLKELRPIPLVHGLLRDGRYVTLTDVIMTGMIMNMPGAASEVYYSSLGFIGDSVLEELPLVDRASVTYSHLRDWVVDHPIQSRHQLGGSARGRSADYHYENPEPVRIAGGGAWQLSLAHTASVPFPSVSGFILTHDCHLRLVLSQPLTYDALAILYLVPLWQFLSFCLDRNIGAASLDVEPVGDQARRFDVGVHQTVDKEHSEAVTPPFMLLDRPQLGERLNCALDTWLRFEGDERRATSILVSLSGGQSLPLDLKFLAAAQALEALTRVGARECELDDDEFNRRCRIVRESIADAKVRKWADRKLEHSNTRAASELLCDLLTYIGGYADSLAKDQSRFVDDIRDNRNFYTHRDDRRADRVLDGEELYNLTEGILLLLKATVLRRLGFSPEETAATMNACQGTLQARARVAEQYDTAGKTTPRHSGGVA